MKRILFAVMFLFLFSSVVFADTMIRVLDGDTVLIDQAGIKMKVRLYGIDCPEKKQPFGPEATAFTTKFLTLREFDTEIVGKPDRYGRYVGIITCAGENLNARLVEEGYAWVYNSYCRRKVWCNDLKNLQYRAQVMKLGLWVQEKPVPPWQYRKEQRN